VQTSADLLSPAGWSRESELIVRCARSQTSADGAERIGAIADARLDWSAVIDLAEAQGVLPILHSRLRSLPDDALPAWAWDRLDNYVRQIQRHNLHASRELLEVLRLLSANGIRVLPLKGPALALTIYGNLGMRQFADLDILVNKSNVGRAYDLLASRGYQHRNPMTRAQQNALLRSNVEYELVRNDGSVFLDLHWGIMTGYSSFAIPFEQLWERRESLLLGGQAIATLSTLDTLLILCAHGCKSGWSQLKWVVDVAKFVENHPDLDWNALLDQAATLHAIRMVLLGLRLAADMVGTDIPPVMADRLHADGRVGAIAARIQRGIFRAADHEQRETESILLQIDVSERLSDKAAYCLRLLLQPNHGDAGMIGLPAPLAFLYVPIRPFRVAGKYLPRLLRHRRYSAIELRPPASR